MYHGPDAGCSSNAIKLSECELVVTKGIISKIKSRVAQTNCKQEEKETTACDPKIIKDKTLIVAKNENGAEAVYKNGS